jgi:nicotinate-nucleotide adenylyltransferase
MWLWNGGWSGEKERCQNLSRGNGAKVHGSAQVLLSDEAKDDEGDQWRTRTVSLGRLGILGGSFDPVHVGHLLVARAAREELGLERMFFVPAAQSPFKPDRQPTPATERLRLLRLALAGQTDCEVDDQEIRRGGVSYTIDTVRDYAGRFPTAELFYLIGADNVELLPKWRDSAELAGLARFAAVPRPGEREVEFPAPFRGQTLRGFPFAVSSSDIRKRVKGGASIEHLVPAAVAEAVRNNRLYL